MHADLAKLLDLQAKDSAVVEVERRLGALRAETSVLDQALDKAREGLEVAKRAAVDAERRRDELEQKIESYRVLQERCGWSTYGTRRRPPPSWPSSTWRDRWW